MVKEIKLRNGIDVDYDEQAPITLYETIISEVLIPKYKDNKDWNLTINIILEEMNEIISKYELDPKLKIGLLNQVETHLDKDIEELTGCDKIDSLFMKRDDFVEDIEKLIISGKDKQELRNDMANLIFPLTVFELGELFIYLGKRAFLK